MDTVLFVIWRSQGHLNASLGLAKGLRRLGYRVIYTGPTQIRDRVQSEGFECLGSAAFDGLPLPIGVGTRIADLLANWRNPRTILKIVIEGRQILYSAKKTISLRCNVFEHDLLAIMPKLVVFDPFLLYFYAPVHAHKIPAVALSTKSLASAAPDTPPYTVATVPRNTFTSRMRIRVDWFRQHTKYAFWRAYQYALFGVTPQSFCKFSSRSWQFNSSKEWRARPFATDLKFACVPEWVLYPPCFDFPRDDLRNQNAHYLGAYVDLDRNEEDFSIPVDFIKRPLIVCVLTSVFRELSAAQARRNRFLAQLLNCMEGLPEYQAVIAVGPSPLFRDARLPENVTICSAIPTLALMKKAALLITQGGGNTVKEGILNSVSLLTIPDAADQPGLSARLEYHGLSASIAMHKVKSDRLRYLILDSIGNNERRRRIENMRTAMIEYQKNDDPLRIALKSLFN